MKTCATLILLSVLGGAWAAPWTVDGLFHYYQTCADCDTLINPDGILPAADVTKVLEKIALTKDFRIRFIIIDHMDKQNDIDSLVEFFLQKIEPSPEGRRRSLTVLYAIGDRKYKWRTGEEARKLLSDSKCDKIAEAIKKDLKANAFGTAFVKLFQMITEPEPTDWATVISLSFAGFFVSLMVVCACIDHRNEKLLGAKIRTVKEIAASPEKFKVFEETSCVICFEELDNSELKKPADSPQGPTFQRIQSPDLQNAPNGGEIFEDKRLAADTEQLLPPLKPATKPNNLDSLPPNQSTFLECGHNFHAGCLKDWMKSNDTCPLCRVRVQQPRAESTSSPAERRNMLLELLNITHTSFGRNNIYYYYDHGRMEPTSSSSGGSSGRSGFDFGSGGTSGGW